MNDYQKFQKAKQEAIARLEDNSPTCDCGKKTTYTPARYPRYTCWPCYDKEQYHYHGTECHCQRCMSE